MAQSNPQDSEVPFCTIRPFADEAGKVAHGFFGRQGGESLGVYGDLNCGIGSDEDVEVVMRNRAIVAGAMGVVPENLLSLYQVHGDACLKVSAPWPITNRPQADAFVTDVPGIALGILTADCAPVLFCADGKKPVVGATHAGWGGAFKGVLEATVQGMEELGAAREDIRACIGPCIHKSSYEVGAEFYERFTGQDFENEKFFQSARKKDHFMFDLAGYCANRLYKAGVSRVYIKDLDTYFNEEDFFSYRRSVHRGEQDYGRQISVVALRG